MTDPLVTAVAIALGLLPVVMLARRHRRPTPRTDGGTQQHHPSGIARVLTTVNHRDIGLLYLAFALVAALWGGVDALMLRTELLTSSTVIWSAQTYNALFTTHGLTMLFFFATPAFTGFANYFLPLLIGADDMAFPRINAIAFWLLPPALVLARMGLIAEVIGKTLMLTPLDAIARSFLHLEPPTMGWTLYTPMSAHLENPQVNIILLGLHLSGIATVMAAINIIVTVFTERAPDITWARLDIFSWTLLTTSALIIFAFPLLGSALIMLLMDRVVGTTFFAVSGGGPILWQHLFWFFGHPEVYILVLPAFGLLSLLIPKFSGRKLFGFKFLVYSTLAIGVLSFGVWAHHMFATGLDIRIQASFMAVSLAIAVPSAVKTFNWITTMWNGRIRLTAPMLFCIGSIALFIIGGITGVFLAAIPVDLVYHGTYYVVGHFHLIIMGIIPFSMFAASYYWYPLLTGRMYNRALAKLHAVLTIAGAGVTFSVLVLIGMRGLPRRYANYPPEFALMQQIATVGAYVIGIGVMIWMYNMVQSFRVGKPIEDADPWGLRETGQFTREWQWFEEKRGRANAVSVASENANEERSDS